MKINIDIQNENYKTSVCIGYCLNIVKVTVAKNRKMVSVQLLEFRMRYGHETSFIAC